MSFYNDGSQGDESMYDYIAGYNDDDDQDDDGISLFDFEDSQLIHDPTDIDNQNTYYDQFDQESFNDELSQLYESQIPSQESQIQINFDNFDDYPISASPSPTPHNTDQITDTVTKSPSPPLKNAANTVNTANKETNANQAHNSNTNTLTIPTHIINDISHKLVERQHHYHLANLAASPQFTPKKSADSPKKLDISDTKTDTVTPLILNHKNPIANHTKNTENLRTTLNTQTRSHFDYQHTHRYYNNYNYNYNQENWQKSMWKSHGGARRFFMPLPNRRFTLMHHHEIEQVLRKQLSHMMLPDPLNADFYCGVTHAREGKIWEGFGVPGLNHVYIKKSHKYPRNNDGSPILPPGTLGKTAGFVSVHAPKSMISIRKDENCKRVSKDRLVSDACTILENGTFDACVLWNKDKIDLSLIGDKDAMLNGGGLKGGSDRLTDKAICKCIESGYDHLMDFERCNASIFYVHQESECRMIYNTRNGLINSRSQRDDMNIFNICLQSRDQTMKLLVNYLDLTNPNKVFYRLLGSDKGRKLIYRVFLLFEANNYVFIVMLKLLCAKIYLFATINEGKKICDQDIQFPDKLKHVMNPKEYHSMRNNYDALHKKYMASKGSEIEDIKSDATEAETKQCKSESEKRKKQLIAMENRLSYLKEIIPPRLSTENALIILQLIIKNIEAFAHIQDRKLLFKSRLVCCIISVIIKVSQPKDLQWIELWQKLFDLLGNDLTFMVPGLTRLQSKKTDTNVKVSTHSSNVNISMQTNIHNSPVHKPKNPFIDSIVIPSVMTNKELEICANPNVHQRGNVFAGTEYYTFTGKNLIQWSVLMASPRIRWEFICDVCIGCDESVSQQMYTLSHFWTAVKESMFYYPPARFLAHNNPELKRELYAYFNKMKDAAQLQMQTLKKSRMSARSEDDSAIKEQKPKTPNALKRSQSDPVSSAKEAQKSIPKTTELVPLKGIQRSVSDNAYMNGNGYNNPHPYSHPQFMHHYVHQMRGWLKAFQKNELKQLEKEREHQINMEKQSKRQREYELMLQQKKDAQNERFKQQFFKQLKEKGIEKEEITTDTSTQSDSVYKHLKPSPKRQIIPGPNEMNSFSLKAKSAPTKETIITKTKPVKESVVIKATTPDLDKDFKFVFEIKKDTPQIQEIIVNNSAKLDEFILNKTEMNTNTTPLSKDSGSQDTMSSCSSSDNCSLASLGIGLDPFALNNRYYHNIIGGNEVIKSSDNSSELDSLKSMAQKAKEEKLLRESEEKKRLEEERMMAAHGMQQINLNPVRNGMEASMISMNGSRNRGNAHHRNDNRHMNGGMIDHGHSHSNNNGYNNHMISPGIGHNSHMSVTQRSSRNRYYGHNHYYYQNGSQQSGSNGYYNTKDNGQQRRREHHQYNRYSNRRDKGRKEKYGAKDSYYSAKDTHTHSHSAKRDMYYDDGYYRDNGSLPPRMRDGSGVMNGGKGKGGKRSKDNGYRNESGHNKYREIHTHKNRDKRDRNGYKMDKNGRNGSYNKRDKYYDHSGDGSGGGKGGRDRYRNRDNHSNSSRYYQYKSNNSNSSQYSSNSKQYSSNSKQYNYSRKSRR